MHALMQTLTITRTHSQSHTLAEVGDMVDVRSVSGFRGGDGQGIRIADMQEIGYVSVIRSVEGSKKGRFRNEKFTATGHGRTKSSLLLWSRDQ